MMFQTAGYILVVLLLFAASATIHSKFIDFNYRIKSFREADFLGALLIAWMKSSEEIEKKSILNFLFFRRKYLKIKQRLYDRIIYELDQTKCFFSVTLDNKSTGAELLNTRVNFMFEWNIFQSGYLKKITLDNQTRYMFYQINDIDPFGLISSPVKYKVYNLMQSDLISLLDKKDYSAIEFYIAKCINLSKMYQDFRLLPRIKETVELLLQLYEDKVCIEITKYYCDALGTDKINTFFDSCIFAIANDSAKLTQIKDLYTKYKKQTK